MKVANCKGGGGHRQTGQGRPGGGGRTGGVAEGEALRRRR
jgi:hypothetical protein